MNCCLAPPARVLEQEWSAVCSILVEVWKQRQWADWQLEERTQGITLSQDFFQPLPIDLSQFPPPPPPALDPWRGDPDTLLDWQTTLQSRLDSETTVLSSLAGAVSEVEKQLLPGLRDALVAAAIAPGGGISATTPRALGDQLCISTEYGGCDMVTRVSQAIETFQIILWGVRTGLLAAAYPGLTLAAPDFDEEWKWIGAYGNWRSAMFVTLYPENIALPSLRPIQTPAFRTLVDTLRNIPTLTAAKARDVAETYAAYVRDIFMLEVNATATCATHTATGDLSLTYLFATGPSGTVYWTVSDPTNSDYPYQPWDTVRGIDSEDVVTVIGADSYRLRNGKRYLYVFFQVTTIDSEELAFNRYDLLTQKWEQSLSSLKPPEDAGQFTSVLRQRGAQEDEPPTLLLQAPGPLFYERALDAAGRDWDQGDWVASDRVWGRWTADASTPPLGVNLVRGGRLFATIRDYEAGRIIAPGQDGQPHGFIWYGSDPLSGNPPQLIDDRVPSFVTGVTLGNGGITGVTRDTPSQILPSAGSVSQIDLLAVASNEGVYATRWDPLNPANGGWQTQWSRIGSNTDIALPDSVVTVVARTPAMMEAFFLGAQGLYKTTWSQNTAFAWTAPAMNIPATGAVGTQFHNSELAIPAMASHHLPLFAIADNWSPNTTVYAWDWTDAGSAWSPQTPFIVPGFDDVSIEASLTAVRRSDNNVRLFVPRTSSDLWTAKCDITPADPVNLVIETSKWGDWEQIGDRTRRFSKKLM